MCELLIVGFYKKKIPNMFEELVDHSSYQYDTKLIISNNSFSGALGIIM